MVEIAVVGGVALHIVSEGPPRQGRFVLSRMNVSLGGPAGSVARNLASLGHRPTLISGFADDAAGSTVQHLMARDGIATIQAFATDATDVVFSWTKDDDLSVVASATPVPDHHGIPSLSAEIGYVSGFPGWRECASSVHVPYLVADLGFMPYLEDTDELHRAVNEIARTADAVFIGGASLTSKQVSDLMKVADESRLSLLCISRGRRSALVQVRGARSKIDVRGTRSPVDVMSAGDALVAGFMHSISLGKSEHESVRDGLALASRSVAVLGDGRMR